MSIPDPTESRPGQGPAQALRRREAQLRRLLDALPVLISHVGPDLRYRFVNRAYEGWFGRPREAIVGQHVRDVLGAAAHDAIQPYLDEVLRGREVAVERRIPFLAGPRHVRAAFTPNRGDDGAVDGFFVTVSDITDTKQRERERLARTREQRDVLVREVHHRIKNHLQGVVGLLRQHLLQHPEAARPLESAIAQVQAVALVHGLQTREEARDLQLSELIEAISRAAQYLRRIELETTPPARSEASVRVAEQEAVPVALVLNELVTNACKHAAGGGRPVRVRVTPTPDGVRVGILSPGGRLPAGFDLDRSASLGTGLSLVKSLLPERGSSLKIRTVKGGVRTDLELGPPVVRPEPGRDLVGARGRARGVDSGKAR